MCMHSGAVMGSRRMPWHRSQARHSAMPCKDLCTTSPSPISLSEGPASPFVAIDWCLQEMHADIALLIEALLQQRKAACLESVEAHTDSRDRIVQGKESYLTTGLKEKAFSSSPHATACMPGHDGTPS